MLDNTPFSYRDFVTTSLAGATLRNGHPPTTPEAGKNGESLERLLSRVIEARPGEGPAVRLDDGIVLLANANLLRTPVGTTSAEWTPGGLSAALRGLFDSYKFSVVGPFLHDAKFLDYSEMVALQRAGQLKLPHELVQVPMTRDQYHLYYDMLSNMRLWFWAHGIRPQDVAHAVDQCIDPTVRKRVERVLLLCALDSEQVRKTVSPKLSNAGIDVLAVNRPQDIAHVISRCGKGSAVWEKLTGLLMSAALDDEIVGQKVGRDLLKVGIDIHETNNARDLAQGIIVCSPAALSKLTPALKNAGIDLDTIPSLTVEGLADAIAKANSGLQAELAGHLVAGGVDLESIRRIRIADEIMQLDESNPVAGHIRQTLRINGVSLPQARRGDLAAAIEEHVSTEHRKAIAYMLKEEAGIDLEVVRQEALAQEILNSKDAAIQKLRGELIKRGICLGSIAAPNADWAMPAPEAIQAYYEVNKNFADSAVAQLDVKPRLIWIHDYHLMLAGQMIRDQRPSARIAYFHHIPFLAPDGENGELWKDMPKAFGEQLVDGLLGCDQLGFHTRQYKNNFILAAERRGAELVNDDGDTATLRWQGRLILVTRNPISVDIPTIERDAQAPAAQLEGRRFSARYGDHTGLTITRADWTKAILQERKGWMMLAEAAAKGDAEAQSLLDDYRLVLCLSVGRQNAPLFRVLSGLITSQINEDNIRLQKLGLKPIALNTSNLNLDQVNGYSGRAKFTNDGSVADGYLLRIAETVTATPKGQAKVCILGGGSRDGKWVGAGAKEDIGPWCTMVDGASPESQRDAMLQAMRMLRDNPSEAVTRTGNIKRYYEAHTVTAWATTLLDQATEGVENLADGRPRRVLEPHVLMVSERQTVSERHNGEGDAWARFSF